MCEWRADFELLQAFSRQGDQPAFATLTRRHLDLVYATALRKVTDGTGAEEICQNVFGALARKAWQFAPDDSLPAWLHRTTLLESKSWLRGELRRRRREEAAAELGTTMKTTEDEPAFQALVPLLDEALLSLREKDRTALLLRFYESHSLRDVGTAVGVSEDAARMRVQSALEKLASFFKRRGFKTVTVAAATAALQHTASSASAAVADAVVSAALQVAPPAITGLGLLLTRLTRWSRGKTAAVCVALVVALLFWLWRDQRRAGQGPTPQPIANQLAATRNATFNLLTNNERIMRPSTLTQFPLLLLSNAWLLASNSLAQSPGQAVVWGYDGFGETNVPAAAQHGVVAMAAGGSHCVALKNDGSVVAWGRNYYGQVTGTPANNHDAAIAGPVTLEGQVLSGVTAIAAMESTSVALKDDGSVVAWGPYGGTNVPVAARSGVTAIAAKSDARHALALKEDGSVVAWGNNDFGQTNVPTAAQGGVVAITVGGVCSVALKSDGSVVVWGRLGGYETNAPPATQSGVIAVAAGGLAGFDQSRALALKNDGSVIAWGHNGTGAVTGTPTTNTPRFAIASPVTLGGQVLSGVTAVAVGEHFSAALKSNGSVVVWGSNTYGVTNVPAAAQSGVIAIAAGWHHMVALKNDSSVIAWGYNNSGAVTGTGTTNAPWSAIASPVTLAGQPLNGVTAISASYRTSLALRGSGWELNKPSADASATVTSTISPNGINATVILDGSRSSDPDGDPLQYTWYEHGAPLATGVVAHPVLPVGTHTIALVVNDGRFSATNAIAVEVITPATAVSRLVLLVENADLGTRNKQPLHATLLAARSAFDRGNVPAALNQLSAFQNQVRAQIALRNPALADQFITAAQQIISGASAR